MSFCWYLLTALIIFKQDICDPQRTVLVKKVPQGPPDGSAGVAAADQPSVPQAPTLIQTSVKGLSVELLCQAPQGSGGLIFQLFKVQQLVDTVKYSSKQREARFVLKGKDTNRENLYCCRYQNSMYSTYISPEMKSRASVNPPSPPHLVVQPSIDHIMAGQTLSFHCQTPPASLNHHPEAFFLIQRARGTQGSMVASPKLVSQSQQAHFSVKTVGREDSGEYVCLYQITMPNMVRVNSTASQPVHISVIDLPVPTLSLSQRSGDVLECVGSPAYPQASFSLFRVGSLSPEATRQFSLTQHSARFPIPDRYEHGTLYQCQYSLRLGNSHLYSKMSNPVSVPCIKGHHCTSFSAGDTGRADLPLIIGSVSAAVLFLMIISLLSFVVHRHVKSLAEKRRKREQEKLWQQIHYRDHIIDLPLRPADCEDFERAFRGRLSEPIYDTPLTTFTNPTIL